MKNKGLFLIFVTVSVLALAKLLLTAKLATAGAKLAQIEKMSQNLTEQNHRLEEKIVELSSLVRISSEAARLGFSSPTKVVNLTPEAPIAFGNSY